MKKIKFYDDVLGKHVEAKIVGRKECDVFYAEKPMRALVCELEGGYSLYAFKGQRMANYTRDEISDGMDLFYAEDVDTFVTSIPIKTVDNLAKLAEL